MSEEAFVSAGYVRLIPLLPLGAAAIHGVMIGLLRTSLSFRAAAALTLTAVFGSLVVSGVAFATLIRLPDGGAVLDRIGTWIGVGVGPEAAVVDWALRFDPLSSVLCLLVTGVGLLALVYAIGELSDDARDDRGEQRFFAFACLQIAAMLWLVLADDPVLFAAAFSAVGIVSWWLLGFWYADEDQGRTTIVGLVLGRLADAALFSAVAMMFWAQAAAPGGTLAASGLGAARAGLEAAVVHAPGWLGGGSWPAAEIVALLVVAAIALRAAQLPLSGWLAESVGAPIAALVLVHGVTTVASAIVLGARFSFLFVDAPFAAGVAAWIGASTALVCAVIACAQVDALRVLAWSTASQMGYAVVALAVDSPTAAVFHVIAHAFAKALALMAMGAVVASLGGERSLLHMGNLGSRLWRTRIDTWIAVISIGGVLPISIGFFSLEHVVVAAGASDGLLGSRGVYVTLLLAVTATGFYAVRLTYLSLYGDTRIPAHIRWDELEDPGPVKLWPMGILAAFTIGGALMGTPQNWADLLFTDVAEADSLHHFLAPALGAPIEPARASADVWTDAGRAVWLSSLGALPAVWLYLYRPGWLALVSSRVPWLHRALARGLGLEPLARIVMARPVAKVADRVLDRGIERTLIEGTTLRTSTRLLHGLANGWLRRLQSGRASLYVAVAMGASVFLVAFLVLGGRG